MVCLAAARYSSTTPSTISMLARPRIERARGWSRISRAGCSSGSPSAAAIASAMASLSDKYVAKGTESQTEPERGEDAVTTRPRNGESAEVGLRRSPGGCCESHCMATKCSTCRTGRQVVASSNPVSPTSQKVVFQPSPIRVTQHTPPRRSVNTNSSPPLATMSAPCRKVLVGQYFNEGRATAGHGSGCRDQYLCARVDYGAGRVDTVSATPCARCRRGAPS
jgi:hypothetical protein